MVQLKVITPVFLDVFLLFCYMNKRYKLRGSHVTRILSVLLLMFISFVIEHHIMKGYFTQILLYLLAMPFMICLFDGDVISKAKGYLKFLSYLLIVNFGGYFFLNHHVIKNENNAFFLFIVYSIALRLGIYFYLHKKEQKKNISYFELGDYIDILIKIIIVLLLLIGSIYCEINVTLRELSIFDYLKIVFLSITVFLVINIYEDMEQEADKMIKKMKYYQQEELERNYLDAISEQTKELAKIRHDIKNYMFMINYLASKDDLDGIKKYLNKIPALEGEAMLTIPQKEWLGALVFTKAERAKKMKIDFKLINKWEKDLKISMDNMDLLNLIGNLLDNSIEAAARVPQEEKRKCILILNEKKGYLLIDVINSYHPQYLKIVKGKMKTSKKDKSLHGKGMEIINSIVNKYCGNLEYEMKDENIRFQITLLNTVL